MPLYEFHCPKCDLVETFFSKRASSAIPSCPHCGGALEREVSRFSTGGAGAPDDADAFGGSTIDPARAAAAERELGSALEGAIGSAGDDPRAAAKAVREYSAAAGIRFGKEAESLLRAVEHGESADEAAAAFEEMEDSGERFFEDFGAAPARGAGGSRHTRRDPEWHDMPEERPASAEGGGRRPGPWDA